MGNNLALVRMAAMLAGASLLALPGRTQIVTLTDNDSRAQIAVNPEPSVPALLLVAICVGGCVGGRKRNNLQPSICKF
jgi:hypothetical protein